MLQSPSSSSSLSPRHITRSQSAARPSPMVSILKTIKISSTAFVAARKRLELAYQQDKEIDMESSELILAENVSLDSFIQYMAENPRPLVTIRLDNGKIKAYEIPYGEHAVLAGKLCMMVESWTDRVMSGTEYDIIVGENSMRKADFCVFPVGLPWPPAHLQCNDAGQPYPTMVVEIGNSESLTSLDELANGYFSSRTMIQVYLAIKIYSRYPNRTRALVALLYLRSNADPLLPRAISFGTRPLHHEVVVQSLPTIGVPQILEYPSIPPQPNPYTITSVGFDGPPCNARGIPDYHLNIPAALIFNGTPGIPAGLAQWLDLDLFVMQERVNAFCP